MSFCTLGRRNFLSLHTYCNSSIGFSTKASLLLKPFTSRLETSRYVLHQSRSLYQLYRKTPRNSFYFCNGIIHGNGLVKVPKIYFSSDGDRDLAHFLKEEIAYEEDNVLDIPKFKDFKVEMNETLVTLTRSLKGERIEISFDVNDNVNVDEDGVLDNEEYTEEEMQVPDIISYPSFTVKIEKQSGKVLHFTCTCNAEQNNEEDSDVDPNQPDGQFDIFRFDNVKLYNKNDGIKNIYEAETETMDGELYSMLMTYLLERGVTGHFVNDLLDLSTTLEQRHYLTFLKSLRDFVIEK